MTTREALFKLLRIGIGIDNDLILTDDVNISEVLDLSEYVGVNSFAVSGLQKLIDEGLAVKVEKQRLLNGIGLSLMIEQKSKLQWDTIQKLVELFDQNGITTVGLKGITVAQLYPNPMLRDSCDFDCFLLKKGADGSAPFPFCLFFRITYSPVH